MKIYYAFYDSRNFTFEAFSQSKSSARFHLLTGLRRHCEQYNLELDWFSEDGIEYREYEMDTPYRDYEPMKIKTNTQLSRAKTRRELA